MNGSAFYTRGQKLDAAPVSSAGATDTSGDDSLIPDVQFRADATADDASGDELPYTGFPVDTTLAVAACACARGLFVVTVATRRRPVTAGEKR